MTQSIEEFVAGELQTDGEDIGYEELRGLWSRLYPPENPSSDTGWEAFAAALAGATGQADAAPLSFRPGGWTLKIRGPGVTGAIATALLAGALAVAGVAVVPAVLLPAILPIVFQTDHVELTKGDEYILATLRLQTQVREEKLSADQIYALLPEDLRSHLALPDLINFLDRCRKAGLADVDVGGVRLRDPVNAKFRLTVL